MGDVFDTIGSNIMSSWSSFVGNRGADIGIGVRDEGEVFLARNCGVGNVFDMIGSNIVSS